MGSIANRRSSHVAVKTPGSLVRIFAIKLIPPTIRRLPFIFRLETPTERRNDLARRILRILQSDPLLLLDNRQDYWVEALVSDETSHRQSEVGISLVSRIIAAYWAIGHG
jgi:hypothetical protein